MLLFDLSSKKRDFLPLGDFVVSCLQAQDVALKAADLGFRRIHAFTGGLDGHSALCEAARSIREQRLLSCPFFLAGPAEGAGEAGGQVCSSLDCYSSLSSSSLRRVSYFYLGALPLAALRGSVKLLKMRAIDYIEIAEGCAEEEVNRFLLSYGYKPYYFANGKFEEGFADKGASLFVAPRFQAAVFGSGYKYDIAALLERSGIKARGAIMVGAHDNPSIEMFRSFGVSKIIYVEANPAVYERLCRQVPDIKDIAIVTVNCAVSDNKGKVRLNVTSMDQSSSILPLKRHEEIYPDIQKVQEVEVDALTLDDLLDEVCSRPEFNFKREDFNLLMMDIQGAEMMALKGASRTLQHIEAIDSEINYEELYAGCPLVGDMDAFLDERGFKRVGDHCFYHHSWGDSLYVRKPKICMSTLGSNGRFANQLFQYAFLRICAEQHGLDLETPSWIGEELFGLTSKRISCCLPEKRHAPDAALKNDGYEHAAGFNHWGYYQFHTGSYAPFKGFIRNLFRPTPQLGQALSPLVRDLRKEGNTLVALHLRRGDFETDKDFWCAPSGWYLDWLQGIWGDLEKPVLFIASDEPQKVLADFHQYKPFIIETPERYVPKAPFYPDFHVLSQADVVAVSNSSFSFFASMLNERARWFFRPHRELKRLVAFDPWSSEVLWR